MSNQDTIIELSGRVRAIDRLVIDCEHILESTVPRSAKDQARADLKMYKQEQQKYINRINRIEERERGKD